jgi:hypothetical protein
MNIHRIVEIFFLVIAIASSIAAAREIALYGWDAGRNMLFVPAMAFGWFFMRRTVRKRLAK